MNFENCLITGGSGMVGSNIHFGYKPTSYEMDITDINSIEKYISRLKNVSCIIHLAAVNLRESENNYSKAINVNINGTTNMLNVAMKYDIPFVILSTGAVFSNTNSTVQFDENFKTYSNFQIDNFS
jgi:dTDP-4-dehydrorhamnose reductase